MKSVRVLLLAATLATPAHGQSAGKQGPSALTCGAAKAESTNTTGHWQWTISGPSGKTTETGVLKSGPLFECIDGAILVVEFASTAGHSVFTAYFPDGTDISYGRQQVERRGARWVLPIQAKPRIAAAYRAAFDYHCRLEMPADPIPPNLRGDCLF
ncbi:MAG: hypothetical protein JOY64_10970 [Alphaproteobacteria bacterium]|nr:hypothetical protein [Alphaproteobacteria bacterium]